MTSASEVAFFSLNPQQINALQRSNGISPNRILNLLEKPRHLLATILITNNLINICIIILSTQLLKSIFIFPEDAAWLELLINTVAVTFLLVLFGEVMPKVYANVNNLKVATFTSMPLLLARTILYPFSSILVSSTNIIENRLKGGNSESINLYEIDRAIDMVHSSNAKPQELDMLKGIVKFGNITVKQIMRSRLDISAIEKTTEFLDLLKQVNEWSYSRIPIYEDDLDHIIGVLFAKDLLEYMHHDNSFEWQKLIKEAKYVPESKKIYDLLKEMQISREHLAIAVDEYGGTCGIITLEDILEEIVGDIHDEYDEEDEESQQYKKIDRNNFTFDGRISMHKACKVMRCNTEIFDTIKGESETIAGMLLEISGHFPAKNETIAFKNFRFTVLSKQGNRIENVKVTITPQEAETNNGDKK